MSNVARKRATYFEQVPLAMVKKLAKAETRAPVRSFPLTKKKERAS